MNYMQDIMNKKIVLMLQYMKDMYCGSIVENGIKTTLNSQGRLDALSIDDPLEYVRLALDEENAGVGGGYG